METLLLEGHSKCVKLVAFNASSLGGLCGLVTAAGGDLGPVDMGVNGAAVAIGSVTRPCSSGWEAATGKNGGRSAGMAFGGCAAGAATLGGIN